jgi:hypothetical protein
MAGYIIHIEYREGQELAWVEINGLSEESRSARKCRFQTIGWILDVVDTVHNKTHPDNLLNESFALDALIKYAKMDAKSAEQLLVAKNWRKRFEVVWEHLDDFEREEAVTLNYNYWDNYWPGFDTYNVTLRKFLMNYEPQITDVRDYDPSDLGLTF